MDFMNWNVQALHLWILSGSRLNLVYLYYTHACPTLIFLVFHSYVFLYKGASFTIYLWSTDMAPLRCRTRVRREGRRCPRIRPRPAASCHGDFFLKADSHQRGSDSGRFALNWADSGLNRPKPLKRPIQAEIQKKKKKCKTHRLN